MNQPDERAPIPSSVYAIAAVWLVVFALVLHEVGFAWATGLSAAIALCALFLISFLVVRSIRAHCAPGGGDHGSR